MAELRIDVDAALPAARIDPVAVAETTISDADDKLYKTCTAAGNSKGPPLRNSSCMSPMESW
jgi:hypothetical protein